MIPCLLSLLHRPNYSFPPRTKFSTFKASAHSRHTTGHPAAPLCPMDLSICCATQSNFSWSFIILLRSFWVRSSNRWRCIHRCGPPGAKSTYIFWFSKRKSLQKGKWVDRCHNLKILGTRKGPDGLRPAYFLIIFGLEVFQLGLDDCPIGTPSLFLYQK